MDLPTFEFLTRTVCVEFLKDRAANIAILGDADNKAASVLLLDR